MEIEPSDLINYFLIFPYIYKWKVALMNVPPEEIKFGVSFIVPLFLIPLAVKGIQSVAKAVKESKAKKEAEK